MLLYQNHYKRTYRRNFFTADRTQLKTCTLSDYNGRRMSSIKPRDLRWPWVTSHGHFSYYRWSKSTSMLHVVHSAILERSAVQSVISRSISYDLDVTFEGHYNYPTVSSLLITVCGVRSRPNPLPAVYSGVVANFPRVPPPLHHWLYTAHLQHLIGRTRSLVHTSTPTK